MAIPNSLPGDGQDGGIPVRERSGLIPMANALRPALSAARVLLRQRRGLLLALKGTYHAYLLFQVDQPKPVASRGSQRQRRPSGSILNPDRDRPRRISASLLQTGEGQPAQARGYPGQGSRLPDLARIRAVQDKRLRTYAGNQQKSARHGATFGWRSAERGHRALGRATGSETKIPIDAIFVGRVTFPQGTKGGQPHEQDPRSHGLLKDSLSRSQFPRNG